jgi:YfiR/HmsC-like
MFQSEANVRGSVCRNCRGTTVSCKRCHPLRAVLWSSAIALQLAIGVAVFCQARPSEFDVKAAYLLNFGKFMRNGNATFSSSHESFDVCVIGEDRIEAALNGLVGGQSIDNRPIRILQVQDGAEARNCKIAFVSDSEGARVVKDLEELQGADVLTVGSSSTFLARGGMIQFLLLSNHVRFAVNLEAVKKTHITLSSELLRVAYSVSGKPAPEVAQ